MMRPIILPTLPPKNALVCAWDGRGPMTEAPEVGARYWGITGGYVWKESWDDARYEYARLQAGELFHTEADARAALLAGSRPMDGEKGGM